MKSFWIGAASMTLALTTALPAMAGTFTYTGNLTASPTFDSPDSGTPPTQTVSQVLGFPVNFPYSSQPFFVDTSGSYSFTSTPTGFTTSPLTSGPLNWNPFAVLYQNSFNPATPLINAQIAQANSGNGTPVLFNFNLLANTPYFWVTTVFNPDDGFGTFTNTVTGGGNITTTPAAAIPTPVVLPAILGFGAKLANDRRNQKRRQRQSEAA